MDDEEANEEFAMTPNGGTIAPWLKGHSQIADPHQVSVVYQINIMNVKHRHLMSISSCCFWQAVDTAPCESVSDFNILWFSHL